MSSRAIQPLGIFDSGVGGLTVAAAILEKLPQEKIIYFGDTAHLPYGDKSKEAIRYYSEKITDFLLSKQCKAIVIACNTASSFAYDYLAELVDKKIPVINVIDPVVEQLLDQSPKKIGVIGTKGTIQANVYAEKLAAGNGTLEVHSLATPLFAPMIEEGFVEGDISTTVIKQYLSHERLANIES